ncbi:hypothetical protein N7534_005615 [Penicillium rubens]|nr:hypothetical protein N7534_005615 [Penicillium rubens]
MKDSRIFYRRDLSGANLSAEATLAPPAFSAAKFTKHHWRFYDLDQTSPKSLVGGFDGRGSETSVP